MTALPPYVTREFILEKLPIIFPSGSPNRSYCVREISASTIFTMIYIGAIEGANTYLAPLYVYRMTSEHSRLTSDQDRLNYRNRFLRKGFKPIGERWYEDNTREPIRDETLRDGLQQVGAVLSLKNIATTSSKPRYFLQKDFANLFDPSHSPDEFKLLTKAWQKAHLSQNAQIRITLANYEAGSTTDKVSVKLPSGETRTLSPGLSSVISKAVIEVFAPKFLERPVLLWLSTSADKVVAHDEKLAKSVRIKIRPDENLPDLILVDLAPKNPLFVFVEVVATDGPITERRQKALYNITDEGNHERSQVTFVTVYLDKDSPGFRKTFRNLAWNSFVWLVSEPDKLIILRDGTIHLSKLNGLT